METPEPVAMPSQCPACEAELLITRLQCPACGTEIGGTFTLSRLASLREPHASLIELFLRVEGNVKEMERVLGLSYPTVRARLKEALAAAGLDRPRTASAGQAASGAADALALTARRTAILDALQRGEISAAQAAEQLRELQKGQSR